MIGVGTTFQTGTAPSFSLYDDFEGGASETVLLRSLGDNPIPLEIGIDDPDNTNQVIKWEKHLLGGDGNVSILNWLHN